MTKKERFGSGVEIVISHRVFPCFSWCRLTCAVAVHPGSQSGARSCRDDPARVCRRKRRDLSAALAGPSRPVAVPGAPSPDGSSCSWRPPIDQLDALAKATEIVGIEGQQPLLAMRRHGRRDVGMVNLPARDGKLTAQPRRHRGRAGRTCRARRGPGRAGLGSRPYACPLRKIVLTDLNMILEQARVKRRPHLQRQDAFAPAGKTRLPAAHRDFWLSRRFGGSSRTPRDRFAVHVSCVPRPKWCRRLADSGRHPR